MSQYQEVKTTLLRQNPNFQNINEGIFKQLAALLPRLEANEPYYITTTYYPAMPEQKTEIPELTFGARYHMNINMRVVMTIYNKSFDQPFPPELRQCMRPSASYNNRLNLWDTLAELQKKFPDNFAKILTALEQQGLNMQHYQKDDLLTAIARTLLTDGSILSKDFAECYPLFPLAPLDQKVTAQPACELAEQEIKLIYTHSRYYMPTGFYFQLLQSPTLANVVRLIRLRETICVGNALALKNKYNNLGELEGALLQDLSKKFSEQKLDVSKIIQPFINQDMADPCLVIKALELYHNSHPKVDLLEQVYQWALTKPSATPDSKYAVCSFTNKPYLIAKWKFVAGLIEQMVMLNYRSSLLDSNDHRPWLLNKPFFLEDVKQPFEALQDHEHHQYLIEYTRQEYGRIHRLPLICNFLYNCTTLPVELLKIIAAYSWEGKAEDMSRVLTCTFSPNNPGYFGRHGESIQSQAAPQHEPSSCTIC